MPELPHIDPGSTAVLVMDYQVDSLTRFMTAVQSADAIAWVPDLIATARDAGMMAIHVVAAFRPGHPEFPPVPRVQRGEGKRNAGGRERRRRDPPGRGGARARDPGLHGEMDTVRRRA